MAIRKLRYEGDPILEKVCRPVEKMTLRQKILVQDMFDTMYKEMGVGLAAPQVGVLRRAVIVLETNVAEDEEEYMIELVNPVIIEADGEQVGAEGCLSVPGEFGIVKRPEHVKVRAQDRNGNFFEVEGDGLTARAFCHELDHLEGTLFTTKATRMLTPEELQGAEES